MVTAPDHDPRVDDLRQRLRALGYLDAGVDRFVLAPARDARSPWVIASLASLRIGGLAAILLGPATAIGLAARLPTLVTGPRDALIIAIYVAIFFGLAIASVSFALSVGVAWMTRRTDVPFTRRAPLLSRVAGVLVTLACLAYLTLWGQTVIAGVGWTSPAWTASALTLAAAISLLLGHAVTVGSSAVVMANARRASTVVTATSFLPRSPLARWGTRLGIGLVAFGGAALLSTWAERTSASNGTAPTLTVVPSGMRVRIFAIDGLDPMIVERRPAGSEVPPTFGAAASAARVRFSNDREIGRPPDPARAWTTVATGQPPEVHRVASLETRRLTGIQGSVMTSETSRIARAIQGATDLVRLTRPSIASGQERQSKAFWEIAASAGLKTVVINWWATWPASEGLGIVLSDRAAVRLDQGGSLDAEIAPTSLYATLQQRWPALKHRARALAAEALGSAGPDPPNEVLVRSAELDALQILLLSEVTTPTTDLSVVYLPGLDIARYTIREQARRAGNIDHESFYASQQYISALDRLLASVMEPRTDELVILLTQPGRVDAWTATHHDSGRVSARGSIVNPTATIVGNATDIAATVCYALGVPISRDLAGKPIVDLFTKEFAARYPVRYVDTYGPPTAPSAARSGQPLDRETIDRLRSLGYLK